jgi:uncharacterized protein YndB with AHSA1/START domain
MDIQQSTKTVSVTITRLVKATPERVFAAWTTPEMMKQWNAPGDRTNPVVEVDLRVGGRYRIHMAAPDGKTSKVTGIYREIDRPHRLVYTWFWETNPALGEMLVTVEFRSRGSETEIVLVHADCVSEEAANNHRNGWLGALPKLDHLLART